MVRLSKLNKRKRDMGNLQFGIFAFFLKIAKQQLQFTNLSSITEIERKDEVGLMTYAGRPSPPHWV